MSYRALIAATATGILLLGCAARPSAQAPAERFAQASEPGFQTKARAFAQEYASVLCSGSCPIRIVVREGCNFQVTPPTVGLARGNYNVPIQWTIDPSSAGNAQFAPTRGIVFKLAASAREFDGERRVSDTHYIWNDKNPTLEPPARHHPYGINVVQNGRPCPTFDPTIVNDF